MRTSGFQEKLVRLQKAMTGAEQSATEARMRLDASVRAIDATPTLSRKLRGEARGLEKPLREITRSLRGDSGMRAVRRRRRSPLRSASSPRPDRCGRRPGIRRAMENYKIASDELAVEIPKLRRLIETDTGGPQKQLAAAGRLQEWRNQ
jgi:hypothetical protein